jgi:hypothetical protein
LLLALLLAAAGVIACDLSSLSGGTEAVPVVAIVRPPDSTQVTLGDTVPVHATATDSTGVTRAELWVNGAFVATEASPVAQGQPSFSAVFS